jgi:hypothetical protein
MVKEETYTYVPVLLEWVQSRINGLNLEESLCASARVSVCKSDGGTCVCVCTSVGVHLRCECRSCSFKMTFTSLLRIRIHLDQSGGKNTNNHHGHTVRVSSAYGDHTVRVRYTYVSTYIHTCSSVFPRESNEINGRKQSRKQNLRACTCTHT